MRVRVSKAQEEVWEWKEAVYNDIKSLSAEERIEFFKKRSESLLKELGLEKVELKDGEYQLRRKTPTAVAEEKKEYKDDSEYR